jgi:hypothetical protein
MREEKAERSFGRREAKAPAPDDDAHGIVRDAKRADKIATSLDWVGIVIDVESGPLRGRWTRGPDRLSVGTRHSTPVTALGEGE